MRLNGAIVYRNYVYAKLSVTPIREFAPTFLKEGEYLLNVEDCSTGEAITIQLQTKTARTVDIMFCPLRVIVFDEYAIAI